VSDAKQPRAALYLRQSVTRKGGPSVSLETQRDLCTKWAESQGYRVVGVFSDPDTSGSKNAPDVRTGWQELAASDFDVAVVYKIDRLARDFLAFWDTVKTLKKDGRTLASVSENLDLGSPTGKIIGAVLAGLAEQTAADIAERAADTRRQLIRDGRAVGGKVPFGWMTVPLDSESPKRGKVVVQDPATIGWVRGMVQRTLAGQTVYSTAQWLTEQGAPTPAGRSETFRASTVERILRHPILCGQIPFNPGNVGTRTRGGDVLRGENGLPVVYADLAVVEVDAWRRMVKALDERSSPQARPRDQRARTSSLLSGLLACGHCGGQRMWRGTTQGRESYSCPRCGQTISNFEDVLIAEFLRQKGEHLRWRRVEVVHQGGAAVLPEVERRLDELDRLIRDAPSREARAELQSQQGGLLDLRDERRAEAPRVEYVQEGTDRSFREDYEAAATVGERRAVLDDAVGTVTVTRGAPGRRTAVQVLARLAVVWTGAVGPAPVPDETWAA
jgi:site-specific DNA recombinase